MKPKVPVPVLSLELTTHEMRKIRTKFHVLLKDEMIKEEHNDATGMLVLVSRGYAQSAKYLEILEDCEKDNTNYFLDTPDITELSTAILAVHDVEKALKKHNISIIDH